MEPEKKTRARTTVVAKKKGSSSTAKAGGTKKAARAQDAGRPAFITEEERRGLIAEAAFLAAERRSFQGGSAEQDWIEAAAEIDARLLRRKQSNNT